MNKSDLEQIGDLVDKKLEKQSRDFGRNLDVKLKPIYQKLDRHEKRLDALTVDVMVIQKQTKLLTDIHENTKDASARVGRLEERAGKLEARVDLLEAA